MNSENDIDLTILVNTYSQKLSLLINENIILETKLQSLIKDFEKEKNNLLEEINTLRKKCGDTNKY